MAIKIADVLVWIGKKIHPLFKWSGFLFIIIGRYTFFPIIIFVYKNILKIKIKTKYIDIRQLNYIVFIKKYLPGSIIVIIIIAVTTNNILASSYTSNEYANRTLLSNLIKNDQEGWSEIIEEYGANLTQPVVSNYLENQGNLQEIAIVSPFENNEAANIPSDPSFDDSLVGMPQQGPANNRNQPVEYTVQSGDVLGSIAEKFGISVSTILWENNLTWNSVIRPGQTLTILPNSGINHEVKSGDTVLAVANKYQVSANDIVQANKLASASDIRSGDLLFIPGGVKPTKVVSSYQPRPAPVSVSPNPVDVLPAEVVDTGTKLLWPVKSTRITQYYHWGHSGLDIGDKTGSPIYASEAGRIERSGWSKGYGYNVVINHGNGVQTLYAHASKLLVEAGDAVARGDTIALIGSTGWSTGPHLHMEVRINGVRKNPLNYIK